ncbi:MAG: hypothetical protein K0S04_3818 [Herbinix sp.]|jgi:hypothetical protein|nr:hypothetical protein [Herbinix sp.]
MKKKMILLISCVLLLSLTLLIIDNYRRTASVGEDMIKIARKVIPIADAETIDIQIIASVDKERRSLVYFITGNEYQSHSYFPLEFKVIRGDKYKFLKMYKPMNRGMDISVTNWKDGYVFVVNNDRCKNIQITSADGQVEMVEVGRLPFFHYFEEIPAEYIFLDSEGNSL